MSKINGDEPLPTLAALNNPSPPTNNNLPIHRSSNNNPVAITGHPQTANMDTGCRRKGATTNRDPRWATTNSNRATVPGATRRSKVITASLATTPRASTKTSGRAVPVSPRHSWPVWPVAAAWTVCCSRVGGKHEEVKERSEGTFTDEGHEGTSEMRYGALLGLRDT
ncbi:uncharacterized protein PG998_003484 [Apiospora kogelbergensis]|uniref:uncharacterized protein n=1 Tax=Apiospora kogelbergensis TaxID=1337665 RepID=UPI00312D9C3D